MIKSNQIAKPEEESPQPRAPTALNPLGLYTWMASGFHFFSPKAWVCSLLFPVSLQHLRPSWVSFLPLFLACFWSPKFPEKYCGGLVCSGGMAGGPPQQLLLSASKGDQARKTHRKREGVQGLFLCFSGCWCSFRSVCGVSLHHQQQLFFFWGAFGTSSALFFNSSSRPLSNLVKLTMDSKTLWPEAALHS